jgi:hypothetical protein
MTIGERLKYAPEKGNKGLQKDMESAMDRGSQSSGRG